MNNASGSEGQVVPEESGDLPDNLSVVTRTPPRARMACRVEEVLSGDYLILLVDLGIDDLFKRVRVRLQGVDAPEAYKQPAHSLGAKIRDEIADKCRAGRTFVDLHRVANNKWYITLYVEGRSRHGGRKVIENINNTLIERGYVYTAERNMKSTA